MQTGNGSVSSSIPRVSSADLSSSQTPNDKTPRQMYHYPWEDTKKMERKPSKMGIHHNVNVGIHDLDDLKKHYNPIASKKSKIYDSDPNE